MKKFSHILKVKYLIVIFIVILSPLLFKLIKTKKNPENTITPEASILISGKKIDVAVARTSSEKAKGLSGKTHLAENEGMIFVFPQKTYPSFWMIDMNFALDIIWISDDTIVHIDENVPAPTDGQKNEDLLLYKPPKAIDYVLEVNAGYSEKYDIKVGDKVDIRY